MMTTTAYSQSEFQKISVHLVKKRIIIDINIPNSTMKQDYQ